MTRRCARSMPEPASDVASTVVAMGAGVDHKACGDGTTLAVLVSALRCPDLQRARRRAARSRRARPLRTPAGRDAVVSALEQFLQLVSLARRKCPASRAPLRPLRARRSSSAICFSQRATSARSGLSRLRRSASSRLRCFFCSSLRCRDRLRRGVSARFGALRHEPASVVVEVAVEWRRASCIDEDQLVRDRAQQSGDRARRAPPRLRSPAAPRRAPGAFPGRDGWSARRAAAGWGGGS